MSAGAHELAAVFGGIALCTVVGRLGAHAASRARLPGVLGELGAGVLLGNLGLGFVAALRASGPMQLVAELGVLVLLFEVGLESNVRELGRVGLHAALVAVLGVALPSAAGALVSRAMHPTGALAGHLFVGATLAATSVGITARVLRDLGRTSTVEARIVLAAAVLDDVLGLVLLALVAAAVRAADAGGAGVSAGEALLLIARALGFLAAAVALGRALVPRLFRLAAKLAGKGTLVVTALALCFTYAFLAERFGLAPAIGAFVAGLVIEPHDYDALRARGEGSLEEPLAPLAALFVPLFFVLTGAGVDLRVFADPKVLTLAGALTAVAIAGKLAAGLPAKLAGASAWIVGVGMVPRGEVGLIFATLGATLTIRGEPVIARDTFSAVVVMVVLTTMLPPPLLARWGAGAAPGPRGRRARGLLGRLRAGDTGKVSAVPPRDEPTAAVRSEGETHAPSPSTESDKQ